MRFKYLFILFFSLFCGFAGLQLGRALFVEVENPLLSHILAYMFLSPLLGGIVGFLLSTKLTKDEV